MTTVAARLAQLSGLSGVTMAAHLQAIAAGSTVAECLRNYSGLSGVTMAAHLLVDRAVTPAPSGGGFVARYPLPLRRPPREEDEALLFAVILH